MTIEEAIKMLEYIRHTGNGEGEYKNDAQAIAIDMAIKALEQESCEDVPDINDGKIPCEDCISRQSVLKYIDRIFNQGTGKKKSFEFIQKYVEKLPSVTPKEKTGWIPVSERLPETDGRFLTYIENPYDSQLSYIMICDYIRQTWCPDDECASSNVVAWMPLPEPYKAESEG